MRLSSFFGIAAKTLIVLFITNILLTAQVTVIKGKLLDVNGKPSKHGLVGIVPENTQFANYFVKCNKNGKYSIKLTKPGANKVLFSIPGHSALTIPIYNNKNKAFTIDVTLSPYKYLDSIKAASVMGNFNNYNAQPMEKQNDGTFILEVNTDKKELSYQLVGIEKYGRTTNPPGYETFVPDSTGDYYVTMPIKDGKAVIVFDPSKLLISDKDYKVTFSGSKLDEKIFSYFSGSSKTIADIREKMIKHFNSQDKQKEFQYDGGSYFENLLSKIESENDPDVKNYLKLIYVQFAIYNPKEYNFEKASSFFESLDPANNIWGMTPEAFFACSRLFQQNRKDEIQDTFLKNSSSNDIRYFILQDKLLEAKTSGNNDEFKKTYSQIKNDFSNSREVRNLLERFPSESKINVGVEIPDFEVTSLDSPGEKFSKQNMLGKIYMIDFWGTWCGACVGDMEDMHKAYEKFNPKGFEIISLACDESAEKVTKFRNDKWKMPWKNSYIGSTSNSLTRLFEVIAYPTPILVGADGKILAMNMDLRRENLEKTLDKYFSK